MKAILKSFIIPLMKQTFLSVDYVDQQTKVYNTESLTVGLHIASYICIIAIAFSY
jgi:hypothetical protein